MQQGNIDKYKVSSSQIMGLGRLKKVVEFLFEIINDDAVSRILVRLC